MCCHSCPVAAHARCLLAEQQKEDEDNECSSAARLPARTLPERAAKVKFSERRLQVSDKFLVLSLFAP